MTPGGDTGWTKGGAVVVQWWYSGVAVVLTSSLSLRAWTALTRARQSQWEGQACTMKSAV